MPVIRRKTAIVLASLVTVCLACLVLYQIFFPNESSDSSSLAEESTANYDLKELSSNVLDSQTGPRLSPQEGESTDSYDSSLLLSEACAERLYEDALADEGCLAALEEHFIDQPAYTLNLFGMSPKPGPFTFREMIDNYERDRELVLEAMSRPECQLFQGPIRLDLREICNADAVFRLVQFANLCMFHDQFERVRTDYFRTNENRYEAELNRLEALKSQDPPRRLQGEWDGGLAKYYMERNRIRERVLREAWLDKKEKCAPIDWEIVPHEINEIAARLGFEPFFIADVRTRSTLLHWTIGTLGLRDIEFKESVEAKFHWVTQMNNADSMWDPRSRAARMALIARGLAKMRDVGYETDIESLVKRLCEDSPSDEDPVYEQCTKALSEAEQLLEPTDMASLRLLDELAMEALKLGL